MNAILHRFTDNSRERRRHAVSKPGVICEALEERSLLSGLTTAMDEMGRGTRPAEMRWIGAGRQYGMYGGGSLGLGGGMSNPILLLTAPLLEAGSSTSPLSRSLISSSAVQTALQTLQTDLNNDITVGSQPTHASIGALEDTMDAIHKGTLSGTAALTQIQSDQAAILSSMGLTQAQITQIQSDVTALQTAISPSSSASSSAPSTSVSTAGSASTTASSTSSSGTASAVQTAVQTLQTDVQNDTPAGATPTYASIGAVEDDLDAIRKGTLTGTAAVTQIQADTAAVLSSMGLTGTQITQIQTDQQAVQTAVEANLPSSTTTTPPASSPSTSTSSTATIGEVESTLQSVGAYLIGIPGVSSIGMRGMGGPGFGGGFGAGGFGRGPRGGF